MKRCQKNNNADRISGLPEVLILQILCLLSMKDAIATSVLSKQWQSLWKKMHELKFDYRDHNLTRGTFSKDVCTCLLSHKAPVLQSLHLNVHLDRCNPEDTGILIGVAFGLHVLKLVLEVQSIGQDFIFPRSLYTFKTLEILKLKCKVLIDLPSQLCLKSLRTLHLHYVDYKDDESVVNLLSGCPNLRTLSVHRHAISYTVNTFTIAVPSLQKLSIYNSHGGDQNWGYVINAPSLKYLKIKLFSGLGFFLIENVMTDLEEATIVIVPKIIDENILGSLTSVTRLSLKISPLAIKFPTESFFYQLVSLELHENKETWWNLLTSMLDISPKLQVLKLINQLGKASVKWNQPKNVPECLLFHLEIFMWKGYTWQRADEKEVARYILGNANRLKRATFYSKRISHEDEEDLKNVVRDTSSCQLLFK